VTKGVEALHTDWWQTRIAVKVINHLGDEVMKVFKVRERS